MIHLSKAIRVMNDPRQQRVDKLTRIMLESIHSHDIGITPASDMIYQAVLSFAEYASQLVATYSMTFLDDL